MTENNPMTTEDNLKRINDRVDYIKDEISLALKRYQTAQSVGGVSCFTCGYENGKIDTLRMELNFLVKFCSCL